jgi:hypothetical protein
MASQTQSKNATITVNQLTLPDGSLGKAVVSKSGPDAGKIISVQKNNGAFIPFNEALSVSENVNNQTRINAALGAAKSTETLQGVVPISSYDQNIKSSGTGVVESARALNVAAATDPKVFSNFSGNSSGKVFMLPIDMQIDGEGSQDHIRIRALKYTAPQGGNVSGADFKSVIENGIKSANANLPPANYGYEGEVILPIPSQVRDRSSATWAMSRLSPPMAAAVGTVAGPATKAAGGDVLGGLGDLIKALTGAPGAGLFGGGTEGFNQVLAASLSSALLGQVGLGGLEPSDILARTTGKVANPNMELLFRGPNMRAFEFSWKFAARSSAEARRIREIIRFFKIQSLPSVGQNANLINSPNVFFIRYMNGNTRIKSLPQPKICALTEFGIDHTPDQVGWAAYEDSHPVATSLTMQFLELTPLFRNELEEAFPTEDDVGY